MISYHIISTLLNANYDFEFSDDNALLLALQSKVMQGSPCPVVYNSTNETALYKMKFYDMKIISTEDLP